MLPTPDKSISEYGNTKETWTIPGGQLILIYPNDAKDFELKFAKKDIAAMNLFKDPESHFGNSGTREGGISYRIERGPALT